MITDTMPNFAIKASTGFGGPRIALVNYFAGKPDNQALNDITEGEANAALIADAPTTKAERDDLLAAHKEQRCEGESLRDTLTRLRTAADNACSERDRLRDALESMFKEFASNIPSLPAPLKGSHAKQYAAGMKAHAALANTTPSESARLREINAELSVALRESENQIATTLQFSARFSNERTNMLSACLVQIRAALKKAKDAQG